jgi:hypothetical protein
VNHFSRQKSATVGISESVGDFATGCLVTYMHSAPAPATHCHWLCLQQSHCAGQGTAARNLTYLRVLQYYLYILAAAALMELAGSIFFIFNLSIGGWLLVRVGQHGL